MQIAGAFLVRHLWRGGTGYTKGMGTTDQRLKAAHERGTDGTDEEQRQISGGGFIPPFGRIQSNLPFFIGFLSVESVPRSCAGLSPLIRGRSPLR